MKYFFLSEGWTVGRVWETGGLWNERAWRRKAEIERMNVCITGQGETLWLYRVEDAVLMVEVMPIDTTQVSPGAQAIGQVMLRRLITAEQVLEWLSSSEVCFNRSSVITHLGEDHI